jgi:hypothetical protein
MPHYPDDIEYSDKYMDDFYEYRHVLLPKEVYKKLPRGRLLTESVRNFSFRNGAHLEFSNQEDGYITNFIAQNLTFFSSEDQRVLILNLEIHPLVFWLLPTLSSTPDIIHLITSLIILVSIDSSSNCDNSSFYSAVSRPGMLKKFKVFLPSSVD